MGRCETLFVTASSERTRIPRELSWALASWQRALPPPEPENEPDDASARGEQVFLAAAADAGGSAGDLRLMREIQELTAALPKGRREVCPAARLSDVAELLEGELMPRLVSFSGHEFNGSSCASRPRNGR